MRVYFELEARPSWAPCDGAGMEDVFIDFELRPGLLNEASSSLRQQVQKYPVRS